MTILFRHGETVYIYIYITGGVVTLATSPFEPFVGGASKRPSLGRFIANSLRVKGMIYASSFHRIIYARLQVSRMLLCPPDRIYPVSLREFFFGEKCGCVSAYWNSIEIERKEKKEVYEVKLKKEFFLLIFLFASLSKKIVNKFIIRSRDFNIYRAVQ